MLNTNYHLELKKNQQLFTQRSLYFKKLENFNPKPFNLAINLKN